MFIVLEGIDGSGTSSTSMGLARAISEQTERRIVVTQEPTKGPIGDIIRQTLQGIIDLPQAELLYLFTADRKWHLEHVIKPNLNSGAIVISDRYVYSTWCYQQLQHKREFVEMLIDAGRPEIPDYVFVLDAPVDMCLKRKKEAPDLFEKHDILERVRRLYTAIVQGAFCLGSEKIFPIDTTAAPAEVIQIILTLMH